jgi:primosomal protein N' (replication factor Y) (superfamily II helicase)
VVYCNIALPLKPDKLFTYSSEIIVKKGCRVLVSFNNQIYTGIVWEEEITPAHEYKYKPLLDIIDIEPLIMPDLLELASWISRYYHTSLGITLAAMFPAAFNVQVQLQVRRLTTKNSLTLNKRSLELLNLLKTDEWINVKELKKAFGSINFYKSLENLEDGSYIEIKRVFDQKIKHKTVNYVLWDEKKDPSDLTVKQEAAYKTLLQMGKQTPLASISKQFSYAVIKNLVKKELIRIEPRKIIETKELFKNIIINKKEVILTQEQAEAADKIISQVKKNKYHAFLLFGITGSGKTEIYIAAIKQALSQKKTVLMLVPEISLTPQMVSRFYSVFGNSIAILHSHLNDREKWQQWRDIHSGRKRIVIGARSAIFAPLKNIGIIIVDEEHATSYKQETNPRYNGRDMAVLRARNNQAVCLLGSATPSLESWFNLTNGKLELLLLKDRPLTSQLPEVNIIDLRKAEMTNEIFSVKLLKAIELHLENKQQILLLHNRRGYSSFVQCVSCGKTFQCPQCDVSMNYHSTGHLLKCHYCGYTTNLPRKCDQCGGYVYNFGAPGTQQLEKQLKVLFPQARILRMDSDTARKKKSYDLMFQRMKNGDVDILLGTQMIAKGLDFENVTLVGVILADQGLNFPDFRAAETTFQLLTQVAGRSGRGEKHGQVLIQTYNPEPYAIAKALKQDFQNFADREMLLRLKLGYPPYRKLTRILFTSLSESLLPGEMQKIHKLRRNLQELYTSEQLILLGPTEAPFVKLQKRYRYHLILKADSIKTMSEVLNFLKAHIKINSKVRVSYDIDPVSLL